MGGMHPVLPQASPHVGQMLLGCTLANDGTRSLIVLTAMAHAGL